MAAFSTTDEAILTAPLELDPLAQQATASSSGRSIYQVYDIVSTVHKIYKGGFRRVALQFPDEALVDSVPVYWALRRELQALRDQDVQPASSSKNPDALLLPTSSEASTSTSTSTSEGDIAQLYILADTSYGSCCVDEVAAKHVDADLVVHYGHACLSTTARLPVIYVFTKQPLDDIDHAAQQLFQQAQQHFLSEEQDQDKVNVKALVLTYDVAWDHVINQVFDALTQVLKTQGVQLPLIRTHVDTRGNFEDKIKEIQLARDSAKSSAPVNEESCSCHSQVSACCQGTSVDAGDTATCSPSKTTNPAASSCCGGQCPATSLSERVLPNTTATDSNVDAMHPSQPLGPSRRVSLPHGISLSSCGFLYLGPESLSLTNLLLRLGPTTPLLSYNPLTRTSRVETGSTNRLLMKRYTSVLRARDASVVGLLVGTLGVQSYLPLLHHLRKLLTSKQSNRKVYTISVGKLNPAKLANFQEIDVFVLIACPENTLVDSKEFYRPIVTPFEMELAVQAQQRQVNGDEGVDWTGRYVLDLDKLVPDAAQSKKEEENVEKRLHNIHIRLNSEEDRQFSEHPQESQQTVTKEAEDDEDDDDEEHPHFSLITGGYVHRKKFDHDVRGQVLPLTPNSNGNFPQQKSLITTSSAINGTSQDSNTVTVRNQDGTLTKVLQTASMDHIQNRAWKGLEQRTGLDEPSTLEEGREGIAKGYRDADGGGDVV